MQHHKSGRITTPPSRDERIADIRETLKVNKYLISYYTDLINPEHHTASFQVYLKRIDEKAEALKAERRSLIATYDKASNGQIPSLQKQNDELRAKLKKLKATIKEKGIRTKKRIAKAEWLGKRIKDLEQQLRDENFDIESLLESL